MTSTQSRRAAARLGVLGVALLVAGALPWLTGGALAARLIALPLLLAGAAVAGATVRILTLPKVSAAPAAYPAPVTAAGCDGCTCGEDGCQAAADNASN
jgi:hypothetical protein